MGVLRKSCRAAARAAVGQGTRLLHVGSTRAHSRAHHRSARWASSPHSATCSRTAAPTPHTQPSPASTSVLRRTCAGLSGAPVGRPSDVVHSGTVSPARVVGRASTSPPVGVPSGAVHSAGTGTRVRGDASTGATASAVTTTGTCRRSSACWRATAARSDRTAVPTASTTGTESSTTSTTTTRDTNSTVWLVRLSGPEPSVNRRTPQARGPDRGTRAASPRTGHHPRRDRRVIGRPRTCSAALVVVYTSTVSRHILAGVTKRLVDIDDADLDAAREALSTSTIKETVGRALREAAASAARRREVERLLD